MNMRRSINEAEIRDMIYDEGVKIEARDSTVIERVLAKIGNNVTAEVICEIYNEPLGEDINCRVEKLYYNGKDIGYVIPSVEEELIEEIEEKLY